MVARLLFAAMIVADISFVVSDSKLFKPFREWLKPRFEWLYSLVSCGFCMGHWVSFVITPIVAPCIFSTGFALLDCFLTSLLVAWLSGINWIIMNILLKKAGK